MPGGGSGPSTGVEGVRSVVGMWHLQTRVYRGETSNISLSDHQCFLNLSHVNFNLSRPMLCWVCHQAMELGLARAWHAITEDLPEDGHEKLEAGNYLAGALMAGGE